ncbi:hypothetical protein [Haloprofundus halophilus]|uniref:hypothetical protein n=1 Tax=Haloprofundus halophilus TaxID=2283527 RepID=UPI000E44BC5F|nr:hypothetical protein [Haloprofundus halophilus]
MDPEGFQQMFEAMPNIGVVGGFGIVDDAEVTPPETTIYIRGENGGVRVPLDAVVAQDMAELFERLAKDLAVNAGK